MDVGKEVMVKMKQDFLEHLTKVCGMSNDEAKVFMDSLPEKFLQEMFGLKNVLTSIENSVGEYGQEDITKTYEKITGYIILVLTLMCGVNEDILIGLEKAKNFSEYFLILNAYLHRINDKLDISQTVEGVLLKAPQELFITFMNEVHSNVRETILRKKGK